MTSFRTFTCPASAQEFVVAKLHAVSPVVTVSNASQGLDMIRVDVVLPEDEELRAACLEIMRDADVGLSN